MSAYVPDTAPAVPRDFYRAAHTVAGNRAVNREPVAIRPEKIFSTRFSGMSASVLKMVGALIMTFMAPTP